MDELRLAIMSAVLSAGQYHLPHCLMIREIYKIESFCCLSENLFFCPNACKQAERATVEGVVCLTFRGGVLFFSDARDSCWV
jgi:hypothetical protein